MPNFNTVAKGAELLAKEGADLGSHLGIWELPNNRIAKIDPIPGMSSAGHRISIEPKDPTNLSLDDLYKQSESVDIPSLKSSDAYDYLKERFALPENDLKRLKAVGGSGTVDTSITQPDIARLINGSFSDTGRTANGMGEQIDSVLGAPLRVAISEAQKGNFNKDAVKKIINQIHADPRNAPTGFDIAEQTGLENPYAKTAIATIADLAQVPVPGAALSKLAGPMGAIESVGKKAPEVARIIKTLQQEPEAAKIIKTLQQKAPEGQIIKTLQQKAPEGKIIRVGQQTAPPPGKIIRTLQQVPPEPKLIQTFTQPKYEGKLITPTPSPQPATSARQRAIDKVMAGAKVPVNRRQEINQMLQNWQNAQIKAKLGLK